MSLTAEGMRSYFSPCRNPIGRRETTTRCPILTSADRWSASGAPYCKRTHSYFPSDLIQIFGDADIDSLMGRMKCEGPPTNIAGLFGATESSRETAQPGQAKAGDNHFSALLSPQAAAGFMSERNEK
ncbi:hypothetical protein [Mesorhizobium sp. AaZ16]|uniref:hypothetical protein n=1 Tax=Mesorhizobium sp. AaZ16 TaxID=3402289 RepID=UPI00374EBA8B